MAGRVDVVRIETGVSRGTGFLIDAGRVLTALHVIGEVRSGQLMLHGPDLMITAAVSNGVRQRRLVRVCAPNNVTEFDEKLDWACIRVEDPFEGVTPLAIGEIAPSDITAEWSTYGFPQSSPEDGKATTGTVASVDATLNLNGERVSSIQLFSREAAAGTGGEVRGYSGGPVIVDGRVVGILSSAFQNEEGRSEEGTLYAIPWAAVRVSLPVIECPYPGLRPFDESDAKRKRFFGRDNEIEQVLARLRAGERQILVVGPSGSGKSSFVKAGVIPRLIGPGHRIGVRTMRPGMYPSERLFEALDDGTGSKRHLPTQERVSAALAASQCHGLLLLIDQLEELFSQCADKAERQRFVDAYAELCGDRRCAIIMTVRGDFFDDLLDSTLWPLLHGRYCQMPLAPLRGQRLAEAIEGPAHAVRVSIEGSLRERLIADASSEPGALPLLQVTLQRLWEKRRRHSLCLDDYLAMGEGEKSGLAVSVAHLADATLHGLTEAQRTIARRIFLRLVSFGDGRAATRRRQSIGELRRSADDQEAFRTTLNELTAASLLTRDLKREANALVDVVDMAHEALITAWPMLEEWIESRRVDEEKRRRLEHRAEEWVARGRGNVGLLDVGELTDADAWMKSDAGRDVGEGTELSGYLKASHRRERQRRWTFRAVFAAVSVLMIIGFALFLVAVKKQKEAQDATKTAQDETAKEKVASSRNRAFARDTLMEQGSQLILQWHPREALSKLVGALELDKNSSSLQMLLARAAFAPRTRFLKHSDSLYGAAVSANGKRAVTASYDGTARIWDLTTGEPIGQTLQHKGPVHSALFNRDGTRIVTASRDGTARIWDAVTGNPLSAPLEHTKAVYAASFSPDGTHVVTASEDRTARIWDLSPGKQPTWLELPHKGEVYAASFNANGTRVVTASGDHTACVWDTKTGNRVAGPFQHHGSVHAASFSRDGKTIVTASFDNAARIWKVTSHGRHAPLVLRHERPVLNASFSPDGTHVVTASMDKWVRVWNATTGELLGGFTHDAEVNAASFSADGNKVVSASGDRTACVWNLRTQKFAQCFEHWGNVATAVFTPDDAQVVTASWDNNAFVWDVPAEQAAPRLLRHDGPVLGASFSHNGKRVVTVSKDTAHLWDAENEGAAPRVLQHRGSVRAASFSRDGVYVVTASLDKTARVWMAETGEPRALLEHDGEVLTASFSSDNVHVVTASTDHTARIWNIETGKSITLVQGDWITVASFSPDGKRVVTASRNGRALIWDANTGNPISSVLEHQDRINAASFDPKGCHVVTASSDGTARIWDSTGRPLRTLAGHRFGVLSASFSFDSNWVVTAGGADRTARVWNAETGRELPHRLEHAFPVSAAAFSPDGARIVTAEGSAPMYMGNGIRLGQVLGHLAHVWDAKTGKPLARALEHQAPVNAASFSSDGTHIVTASEDGTVRIWSFPLNSDSLEQWHQRQSCMNPRSSDCKLQ